MSFVRVEISDRALPAFTRYSGPSVDEGIDGSSSSAARTPYSVASACRSPNIGLGTATDQHQISSLKGSPRRLRARDSNLRVDPKSVLVLVGIGPPHTASFIRSKSDPTKASQAQPLVRLFFLRRLARHMRLNRTDHDHVGRAQWHGSRSARGRASDRPRRRSLGRPIRGNALRRAQHTHGNPDRQRSALEGTAARTGGLRPTTRPCRLAFREGASMSMFMMVALHAFRYLLHGASLLSGAVAPGGHGA